MKSFSVTCEGQKPFTEAVEMVFKDSAGFSVEEMAIFEKCVLSSSGIKPWRASLALGINPRLRISLQKFLPLSSASLMQLCTRAQRAFLLRSSTSFARSINYWRSRRKPFLSYFRAVASLFDARRRMSAVNHGGVGFRWLTDLFGASLFIAYCNLSVNVVTFKEGCAQFIGRDFSNVSEDVRNFRWLWTKHINGNSYNVMSAWKRWRCAVIFLDRIIIIC